MLPTRLTYIGNRNVAQSFRLRGVTLHHAQVHWLIVQATSQKQNLLYG